MRRPRMLSYAQNGEDVLLARAFPESTGCYLDIGAADPVEFSVTKHFSDRGWAGVNVEPQQYYYDRLVAARPRDVNLKLVVSDRPGSVTLYEAPTHRGFTTADPAVATAMRKRGIELVTSVVPSMTLAELCERHAPGPIDFLKVDVEGHERSVLASADFRKHRPRVLVVEATEQNSTRTNHADWEGFVLGADYRFATFDGLNRYYARAEEPALLETLRVPPNVFDDFGPGPVWDRLAYLEAETIRLTAHAKNLQAELDAERAAYRQSLTGRVKRWLKRAA
jgi:FkbM family methyltransferase